MRTNRYAALFAASSALLSHVMAGININLPKGLCTTEVQASIKSNYDDGELMQLATCLHINHHPSAVELYHHIRKTRPDDSYVLVNLGSLSLKSGDIENARQYYLQYLREVGGPHGEGDMIDRHALAIGPPCRTDAPLKIDCVNALNNLGALELTDGKNASLVTYYLTRAIEIGDDEMLVHAYANLGSHLAKIGDHEGAANAFIRGFWTNIRQGLLHAAAGLLVRRAFLVPIVASSLEETEKSRVGFIRRIHDVQDIAVRGGSSWANDDSDLFRVSHGISTMEDIRRVPVISAVLDDWTINVQLPPFYVHYYGWHDLPLNTAVATLFTHLCPDSLFEIAGHLTTPQPAFNSQKKRVGFISSLMGGDEPHGLLVLDIMRSLKNLFDFYVVSIGSKPLSEEFVHHASGVFAVGYDEVSAKNVLKSLELDCLVYAESMNSPIVYFLGYQRFAHIQILVQGSPVTSGIPTFDYFVSGDLLEHPFRTQLVDDHYSEQLILFDGQAISFPDTQVHFLQDSSLAAGDAVSLSNMTSMERMESLRGQGAHIYTCFQSVQKMQPSFDHVLVDILIGDQMANVVLQASRSSIQTESLQRRLKSVLQERLCGDEATECNASINANTRVHFLPRVKSDDLIQLLEKSTVVLHPFPFEGSKTAVDALSAGVPLITYPQQFLRGRMASVFIKAMELGDIDREVASCCIANSVSDYVTKAMRMASDKEYRSRVVSAIRQRRDRIFNEKMISLEWGRLLTRALDIRMSDSVLRSHIGFIPQRRHQDAHISKAVEDEQTRWRKSVLLGDILGAH
ncbi:hypothetical protein ACHAWU_003023 [Discostella pseudostelligera]|uniref:O-GlcNAc transferase C-terminal domain-containing protein n=1 Tax=Discostella pseudostelligera TaxID=259834 RepID=A0ABD3M5N3_9STRA